MSDVKGRAYDRIRSADQLMRELEADSKLVKASARALAELARKYGSDHGPKKTPSALATQARMAGGNAATIAELEEAATAWMRSLAEHLDDAARAVGQISSGSLEHCISRLDHIRKQAQR